MPGIPVFSLYSATHPPQADVSQAYQLGKGNRNNEILYQISKNKKIPPPLSSFQLTLNKH